MLAKELEPSSKEKPQDELLNFGVSITSSNDYQAQGHLVIITQT